MPDSPNKFSQFWQELKRRKVVRVITVYAAAAFVILELVDIIAEPLKLPEWFLSAVIVILCIGFIIAIILSWIYDIHPEGRIVKTEPAHKVKSEDIPVSTNSWRIATYGSMVVIVGLIMLNVFSNQGGIRINESLDKSIAVLPFINDSPSAENEYAINGYMASIHDNLCRIKDLKVLSLLSTEQYRSNPKPIPEIARELDVSYLLEARGQMYDKKIRLIVQLVDADENIIWSHPFDKQINEVDDHISIQSEIAQSVASKIEAVITPEEQQLIEKIPTDDLKAYDFYQRAQEEFPNYNLSVYATNQIDRDSEESMNRAEALFNKALVYDSTFAQAYVGLAQIYMRKYFWKDFFLEKFIDSVLYLADIALSYDNQLAEAYTVMGNYYWANGLTEKANEAFDKALSYNPNDWQAYRGKGLLFRSDDDNVKSIYNYQKAASLNHGSEFPNLLRDIGHNYHTAGFIEIGNNYMEQAFKLDGDSAEYYSRLAKGYSHSGEYKKSNEYLGKGYAVDSTMIRILLYFGTNYLFLGQFEESFRYYEKYMERLEELGRLELFNMSEIGYVYWKMGYIQESEYYFNKQIEYGEKMIRLNRPRASYYDLAGAYAFRGERDKAYENLRLFNQMERMMSWAPTQIKDDPLFNSMRDEPEFQLIVRDVEAKYQAEHERVRQWLEENDML